MGPNFVCGQNDTFRVGFQHKKHILNCSFLKYGYLKNRVSVASYKCKSWGKMKIREKRGWKTHLYHFLKTQPIINFIKLWGYQLDISWFSIFFFKWANRRVDLLFEFEMSRVVCVSCKCKSWRNWKGRLASDLVVVGSLWAVGGIVVITLRQLVREAWKFCGTSDKLRSLHHLIF